MQTQKAQIICNPKHTYQNQTQRITTIKDPNIDNPKRSKHW